MIANNKLGFMQGRLSAPIKGKIQAFPPDTWKEEFALGKKLGFTCMEWIFENPNISRNPLYTDIGVDEIKKAKKKYGISVNSVVADYFMEKLLFGEKNAVQKNVEMLKFLIRQCNKAEIPILELPFVDNSSILEDSAQSQVIENLREPLQYAETNGITISFETSLPPKEFRSFILKLGASNAKVNYDMGNSASLGFSADEEMEEIGEFIVNVHIKDRVLNGGTVPLGTGDCDFEKVFSGLKNIGYQDDFIFQSAREDINASQPVISIEKTMKKYTEFVIPYLSTPFMEKN
jgi:L-ribulose-5-phosphate 3-epimerase